jgi:hypothetical protein
LLRAAQIPAAEELVQDFDLREHIGSLLFFGSVWPRLAGGDQEIRNAESRSLLGAIAIRLSEDPRDLSERQFAAAFVDLPAFEQLFESDRRQQPEFRFTQPET